MLTVNGGRIVVGDSMQHNETTGMSKSFQGLLLAAKRNCRHSPALNIFNNNNNNDEIGSFLL